MQKVVTLIVYLLWSTVTLAGPDVATYIPEKAYKYAPILKEEQRKYWPDHPKPEVLSALVEHESCITLTHSRCWDPKSQLNTKREFAQGIGQLTKAYNANGSIRFDSLSNMRRVFNKELSELSWSTIATRVDLQARTIIIMELTDYKSLYSVKDVEARLAFTDAAYNGGIGGVNKDRRLCALTKGCNVQLWFGNVEKTCAKSKKAIYGKRGPCDINRHHVKDVLITRSPKYKDLMS
jgi:hypothetical protein